MLAQKRKQSPLSCRKQSTDAEQREDSGAASLGYERENPENPAREFAEPRTQLSELTPHFFRSSAQGPTVTSAGSEAYM
jgi:hypothetical protein